MPNIRFVAVAFQSEVFEEGNRMIYFGPPRILAELA